MHDTATGIKLPGVEYDRDVYDAADLAARGVVAFTTGLTINEMLAAYGVQVVDPAASITPPWPPTVESLANWRLPET